MSASHPGPSVAAPDEPGRRAATGDPADAGLTVWQHIRNRFGELSRAERKVGHVLLGAYPIAGLESVSQLAERAGVSTATVTRFVAGLGYDGYRDFQSVLRQEVQARFSSPVGRYPAGELEMSGGGALQTGTAEHADLLEETARRVPAAELTEVVGLLAGADRISCVGGRISHAAARYLFVRLRQMRPGCGLLGATGLPLQDEVLGFDSGDAIVVLDFRRYQADVVAFAEGAAGRDATIVLVTDRWLSPIADVATHVLTPATETSSPFDSLVGVFGLLEVLVNALLAELGDPALRRMETFDGLRRNLVHGGGGHGGADPAGRP